jgi:hypothetical protein
MDRRDKQLVRGRQPGLEHTRYAIGRSVDPKHPRRETQHHNTVQVHNSSTARNSRFRLCAKAYLSSVLSSRPLLTSGQRFLAALCVRGLFLLGST